MKPRHATVVIGANFGDEGKGLAVDTIAAQNGDAAVIRFNGGAQAGHTVITPDGRRHVFSHVGAGAFAGATTFLSRYFVVQPAIFAMEAAELARHGVDPTVYIDPDAEVATPYDLFINRWVEETRGGARHGSVGIGFGETIERAEHGHSLAVRDICDDQHVTAVLAHIRDAWLPTRLAALGVPLTAERRDLATNPAVVRHYMTQLNILRNRTAAVTIDRVAAHKTLIFEGAQGLLLDMDRGLRFPYVTRSNTGLKNALVLAANAGITHLSVCYMTRSYLTRHGAGPLPNEVPKLAFADIVDPTNQPNPWQGTLRAAPLDLDLLRQAIADDLRDATTTGITVNAGIGVTCLDQIRGHAGVVVSGAPAMLPTSRLAHDIAAAAEHPLWIAAHGPRRSDVDVTHTLSDRR